MSNDKETAQKIVELLSKCGKDARLTYEDGVCRLIIRDGDEVRSYRVEEGSMNRSFKVKIANKFGIKPYDIFHL